MGYSPRGGKESDTTERPHLHFHSVYSRSKDILLCLKTFLVFFRSRLTFCMNRFFTILLKFFLSLIPIFGTYCNRFLVNYI